MGGRRPSACHARPEREQLVLVPDVEWVDSLGHPALRPTRGPRGGGEAHRRAVGRRRRPRPRARHLHPRRSRLGRRGAPGPRGAGQPVARRPHGPRGQPALHRPGDHGDQDLRPPLRLAELDLPAPQRRRARGRAAPLRHGLPAGLRPHEGVRTTMAVDYSERIPNNVRLDEDRRLQRALEAWQPRFLDWWRAQGPTGYQDKEVFLRTAIDVGQEGWASFDYVRMPDYRWGIFLAEPEPDRRVGFGAHPGDPVWQEVPGEHRANLRRLIVVQGDTEPASVEQQRHLADTAPSLYDMRNLFQVNVEEARHLWAMVYLLHGWFGRDGRDEADALLERRSGDADNPRILGAFNEPTPDWLSFFMFTFFTDRDGKYQLCSLAESSFDPLARTCRFMLTEEAHHMFVGESGIARVIQRTCDTMVARKTDDAAQLRALGVIDLPTIQRYLNFHFSVTMDLFGSDVSSNAATFYSTGLKGRFEETKIDDDHVLTGATYPVLEIRDGRLSGYDAPALNALNEKLRDD